MYRDVKNILRNAISPYQAYCSGASIGSSKGYVVMPVLSTSSVRLCYSHAGSTLLDEIIAFDKAEAAQANLTQTNMIAVSSFCGINGLLLGYDLLKVNLVSHELTKKASIDFGLPVDDLTPILEASLSFLGTTNKPIFPIAPGEHVPCAYKTFKGRGPTNIYGAMALAIAKDRGKNADLFMEDLGTILSEDQASKENVLYNLVGSINAISDNLGVKYERIIVGIKTQYVAQDEMGCALIAAPYLHIPETSFPGRNPEILSKLSLEDWQANLKK